MHIIDEIICSAATNADELNQAFENSYNAQTITHKKLLTASWFETQLGAMIAIADKNSVVLLQFADSKSLLRDIAKLRLKTNAVIAPGITPTLLQLKHEMTKYFSGELQEFTTPISKLGSQFQNAAWSALCTIPYGETKSYQEQAIAIGNKAAHRAVANANARNLIAVILPCHRVIKNDGSLGGYGGHPDRKKWLIAMEKRCAILN